MALTNLLFLGLILSGTIATATNEVTKWPTKRRTLTDLSGGFCRSWKFGVCISNNTLYMVGLDGGLVPGDLNATNNYLITLDLKSSFSIHEGSNYKMTLMDKSVPRVKNQALWSDQSNTTLFMYGGRYVEIPVPVPTTYTYNIVEESWKVQQNSIQPTRLVYGAYADARRIQAAYWVGGYEEFTTTPTITDETKKFAIGLIQLNTTTQKYTSLDAPFTPIQEGALVYLPVGELGLLVFLGGEVPSIQDGRNATLSSNSWDHVQVYDIASAKWYNQSVAGTVAARTQFCATAHYDESTSSHVIYVLGGADIQTQDALTDVSYLSIPSFKWYRATPLRHTLMSHACVGYGRQIIGVGGRLAWANDQKAGCYDVPAFIYDAQSQTNKSDFDPTLSSYSLPDSTVQDVKKSPFPSSWADPALERLFVTKKSTNSSDTTMPQHSTNVGAIAGGVVGGVVGIALVLIAIYIVLQRRGKGAQSRLTAEAKSAQLAPPYAIGELHATEARKELDAISSQAFELDARAGVSELDSRVRDM